MKVLLRLMGLLGLALKFLLSLLLYGTPLLGVWLASSLTAYLDGPRDGVVVAGLLLFPILPLLWEFLAWRKRRKMANPPERILTFLDRLSLRTFCLSFLVVAALLAWYPKTSFLALSTRGDWMLDGIQDPRAEQLRRALFVTADGIEWLYQASNENPFEKLVEKRKKLDGTSHPAPKKRPLPSPAPPPVKITQSSPSPTPTQISEPVPRPRPDRSPDPTPHPGGSPSPWPWIDVGLAPEVQSIPSHAEQDLESTARYLVRSRHESFSRIKVLHDYVADRVAYDAAALLAGRYPPQDAKTVFQTRRAVCAGYANLLAAMARVVGENVVVVTGTTRSQIEENDSAGHAWNAAEIDGNWYLLDATWDSGTVSPETGFQKKYSTQYLFPPPDSFVLDHLPGDPRWQLLASPLSQGDFLRQPRLRPGFRGKGLQLLSPTRSRSDAQGEATVEIHNPRKLWLMLGAVEQEKRVGSPSKPTNDENARIVLPLSRSGVERVWIYTSPTRTGRYQGVGSLDFVNR